MTLKSQWCLSKGNVLNLNWHATLTSKVSEYSKKWGGFIHKTLANWPPKMRCFFTDKTFSKVKDGCQRASSWSLGTNHHSGILKNWSFVMTSRNSLSIRSSIKIAYSESFLADKVTRSSNHLTIISRNIVTELSTMFTSVMSLIDTVEFMVIGHGLGTIAGL